MHPDVHPEIGLVRAAESRRNRDHADRRRPQPNPIFNLS
jgi:hypothetical protein